MKKILIFLLIIVFNPLLHTYILLKAFSSVYSANINFSELSLLPLNYDFILLCIKTIFPFTTNVMYIIISIVIYRSLNLKNISLNQKNTGNTSGLFIGTNNENNKIYLPLVALYQNILITGSIGSGKTSSTIFPFLNQLLKIDNMSGLILDVKGNMFNTINTMNCKHHIIVIEVAGKYTYNPLNRPLLKPYILSDRLITILKLFSNTKNTDTYWFDKAGQMLTESIKLIRLYNNGYVNFTELHKIISSKQYILEKMHYVKTLFLSNKLTHSMQYDLNSILSYFQNEYENLDSRIQSIILSEISRLTSTITNDEDICNTFSPSKDNSFTFSFEDIFTDNTFLILNIPIGEYQNLTKIIATYLKLEFQYEVLKRKQPITSPSLFLSDEYQEYITSNDANFLSLSREFKCINIISTQSYSSLLNTLENEQQLNIITQSCINKIFLRTDDIYTIEQAQKLFGKEEKIKISKNVSENAQETNYNYLLNIMRSKKSNISQSRSTYTCTDYVFDIKDFSLNLKTFQAICYLSSGNNMLLPMKLNLHPYFEKE